jgi:immune inhibitor A
MNVFRKLTSLILSVTLIFSFSASSILAAHEKASPNFMPANEEKIIEALKSRGVIRKNASADEAQKVLKSYLQKKFPTQPNSSYPSPKDMPNPKAQLQVMENEKSFKGTGSALDDSKNIPNATPLPLKKTTSTGKILALLVEFGQDPGPLSGNLPKPADPDKDYWVDNFDNAHYNQMLFDKTPGANSLANYYLAQSDGKFTVDGGVFGWIRLPYPESYYGADAGDGNDNLNGPAWRIVQDTIHAAQDQGIEIPYKDFDADGDGYVDSLMVIHSGAGQEGGGGAEGDDAIWSHSWFVNYSQGGVKTNDGTWVGPYTIEPEDGAVGVFAHEYGHQLGLPDLYDTTYIGESSTGFYTLMSSGSWTGKPLGTQPTNLDIWSKMVLGWTPDLTEVYQGPSGIKDFLIHSDETYATFSKGFRINLPAHSVTTDINTPFEGLYEYWSTMGDDISTTMTRTVDLSNVTNATLNFKTWYEIEYDYDYGFVEVSTDNGISFTRIPGNLTRDIGYGVPGIDGSSNGLWLDASYDLSAYAGKSIQLRFHYLTDGGVALKGWAIDQISIPEIGYFDNAEVSQTDWTFNGFRQFAGKETQKKAHYYMGQLVRPFGTNIGLNQVYNYYGSNFERFQYQPGVLLWYRDTAYIDNNVGLHPGQGRLLIVDSHNTPMMQASGKPFRTRVQVWDAPFGLNEIPPLSIHGTDLVLMTFKSQAAVSVFDGSKSYYNSAAPYNSVKTPSNGLKMYVKGISSDGSAARIGIEFK